MQETLSQKRFNQIKELKRTSPLSIIVLRLILLLSVVSMSKNLFWFNHFRQGNRENPQYTSISIYLWRSAPSYQCTTAQGLTGNFRPLGKFLDELWLVHQAIIMREHLHLRCDVYTIPMLQLAAFYSLKGGKRLPLPLPSTVVLVPLLSTTFWTEHSVWFKPDAITFKSAFRR